MIYIGRRGAGAEYHDDTGQYQDQHADKDKKIKWFCCPHLYIPLNQVNCNYMLIIRWLYHIIFQLSGKWRDFRKNQGCTMQKMIT
jgi:hypothetical protein